MADLLYVGDESFDPEDLSIKEKKQVRRLIRTELWEDDMGDFDLDEVPHEEILAATVAVWKQRTDPAFTLDDALGMKLKDILGEDEEEVPPTKSSGSGRRASARKTTSATTGSQK